MEVSGKTSGTCTATIQSKEIVGPPEMSVVGNKSGGSLNCGVGDTNARFDCNRI